MVMVVIVAFHAMVNCLVCLACWMQGSSLQFACWVGGSHECEALPGKRVLKRSRGAFLYAIFESHSAQVRRIAAF